MNACTGLTILLFLLESWVTRWLWLSGGTSTGQLAPALDGFSRDSLGTIALEIYNSGNLL